MNGEFKTAVDLISLAEGVIVDAVDGRHGLDPDRARDVLKLLSAFLTKHCKFTAYHDPGKKEKVSRTREDLKRPFQQVNPSIENTRH